MIRKNFVRIVWAVFEKIEKVQKWPFLVIFGLNQAIVLRYQSYNNDVIAHAGAERLLNFIKIVWTVFANFEILIERSAEKKVRVDNYQ